jgi:hypothetical protein
VVTGKSNARNGPMIEKNIISNESILVKYHEDSAHNLFKTSCWSTFPSRVEIFVVKNTQNAYLNCLEIRFLSISSLGNLSRWLYFLNNWINQIDIHIATQIIRASANRETLKLAKTRKIMENTKTENIFENCINHELNVS